MQLQHPLAVVTPTVDGDVLFALARGEDYFTTGQLHTLLPRRSVDGIRRTLARLVEQGIVDSQQAGRAIRYSLNRDHLAASAIEELAGQQEELVRRIGAELARWPDKPVYAAIFGSASRSQMRNDSDIDLFLVRPDGADEGGWDENVADLARLVTRWTGNDARPLVMTCHEIDAGATFERVLEDIARDGFTVHGPHTWLRRRLMARKNG